MKRLILTVLLTATGFALDALPQPAALGRPRVEVGVSVVHQLPRGALAISVDRRSYYYHRGVFYRHGPRGYVICPAPIGALVHELPSGHTRILYRGRPYYRCGDVYYQPTRHGYTVVEAPIYVRHAVGEASSPPKGPYASYPSIRVDGRSLRLKDGQFFRETATGLVWEEAPIGGIASRLPAGAASLWYQEEEYFELEGVYFRKTSQGYRIVSRPWSPSSAADEDAG